MMNRILSGMQPTNRLQLGNYLGALKNWVDLQTPDYQCLYCVVDMHAITMPYEAGQLATATREVAAAYIAAGVDPNKSSIFAQSSVGDLHAELMWYLATMTQIGKLDRMTQFKDKAGKNAEKAGLGLYAYPVLMAADILIYQATHVPVGEDQKQHLELTRDIASTFNHRYGQDFFKIPEPLIMGEATRVMSLRDGTQKMSKSAESDLSRINLTDTPDMIADKIKRAKSDPLALPDTIEGLKNRPEADNLITIYAALSGSTKAKVVAEFAGKQFSEFKPKLSEVVIAKIAPITEKMRHLLAEPQEIDAVLTKGADTARSIAEKTVKDVKELMGFWKA
jgi:tryptophanyl-tRNA synthetase